MKLRIEYQTTKRCFDAVAACCLLLLGAPVIGVVALVVWASMGTPVLFRQLRPGRDEKLFTIVKFRTMKIGTSEEGSSRTDEERLTSVGRLLRRSSLDELPELWNVLRGEMSLVGPRPLLPEYLPRYSTFERRRHLVRPGITGLAQVSGRNALGWEQRFYLDVWYVENQSFWVDAKILWRTVTTVLQSKNVSQSGHATMPEFLGGSQERELR